MERPITARDFGVDPNDSRAQTLADARSTLGLSPTQRMARFRELLEWLECAWDAAGLTPDERRRRCETSAVLDAAGRWWERIPPQEIVAEESP